MRNMQTRLRLKGAATAIVFGFLMSLLFAVLLVLTFSSKSIGNEVAEVELHDQISCYLYSPVALSEQQRLTYCKHLTAHWLRDGCTYTLYTFEDDTGKEYRLEAELVIYGKIPKR